MKAAAFPTAVQPLSDYLAMLDELISRREPEVLALLPEEGRFERLRREAAELLARYPVPKDRPPLFGVPVGVKDIFRVDGFLTRAGCQLPPELFAGPQASCVTALRSAGAEIRTVTGDVLSANVPATRLPDLARPDFVVAVRVSTPLAPEGRPGSGEPSAGTYDVE